MSASAKRAAHPYTAARLVGSGARAALAAAIALVLICGVAAGLARFGLPVPRHAAARAGWHGVLMLPVFFGAVVSVERAVALGRGGYLAAPVAALLAGVALIVGAPPVGAQALLVVAASVSLVGASRLLRRQAALHLAVLALGVLAWWFGNVVWFVTGDVSSAVPDWLAFLVLTIAAERLELTRMRPIRPFARALFCMPVAAMIVSLGWAVSDDALGSRIFAASLLALAGWLARYDIARHTVRLRGLTRFIAICLLSGYAWLAVAGALGLAGALSPAHPWHDAALHALTLGFVFSMVIGHAPIVLPAVARVRVRYHRAFYLPLVALHGALLIRVAGVLADTFALRRAGAVGDALALLLFALTMIAGIAAARVDRR